MVYGRTSSYGIILIWFVSLARLQALQGKHESNAEFISERNDQNSTDDVYGFINDLVKRSTNDKRNRILPTRHMDKNPPVFVQSQNRAVEESVVNKNEGTSTTSGTLKDEPTDYSATNRASQGLGAKTNEDVLQWSLIRGARDKDKKSSLAHYTHLELLPRGSPSVFITSVVLPTRTRNTNHAQATAVVPSEPTHNDLDKGLIRGSPLPGSIQGISNDYVTTTDERASSYVSPSASTVKYEELPSAPVSSSSSSSPSMSSTMASSSSSMTSSSSLTSTIMASSSSSSLTSSTSSSLSSSSSSSLVQTSSSVLPSLQVVNSKELPSSSSSSLSSAHSASVMLGQSRPSHQVTTMEVVPTPVSTPRLQFSSVATPSLLTSQINQNISSSSSSTTVKKASSSWTSHLNQLPSSSPSSSSSSAVLSSETARTETPLLVSSQLHQGFSSAAAPPSLPSSSEIASLSMSKEFSSSSAAAWETPDIVTTLQNQDHSSSTLSLETPFSQKTHDLSTSPKTEIAKSFTAHSTLILSSLLVTSKTEVFPLPSQQSVYLSSWSKQDVISTGKFTSRDKTDATLDLFRSTTTLSETNSVSLRTNMSALRLSSSTLPVREERVSSVRSLISLPTPSPSVYLAMASLEPSKLPSSPTSSLIKTESFSPLSSLLPATRSLSLKQLSTDVVKSGSSRYLAMPLSPSLSSSLSSSILLATSASGSSEPSSSTTATATATATSSLSSSSSKSSTISTAFTSPSPSTTATSSSTSSSSTSSSSSVSSQSSAHSVAFTSRPSTTTTSSSTSLSAILSPPPAFSSFTSTSSPIPTSSSSSPSLHAYQSPYKLVATSNLSYLLQSTITSASPTPSLPKTHSPVQSSSVSPTKHIPDTTTPFTKISRSQEGKNIGNKTLQTSRKLQFVITSVLSGQQTKPSMAQETPDLSSSKLSTGFDRPSISYGSIKRIAWTPSTKPLRSQTETSTSMSTNTPLDELNQTLSIVSSINGFPHTHNAKRHEGMSSISAPSQLVELTVDSSGKMNFVKTAETQPTLMKASPTAVSKPKGINTKFIVNPSLVIEDSRASETGTHGLHTMELASSKDTMSMRGSLTTTETGKPMASRILVSTVSPDIPRPTRTTQTFLRKKTKGAIGSTSPTAFPKSTSLDYERHSTLQKTVTIFFTQEKLALTRSSATLKPLTFTSDGFPDVRKSASKETRSEPFGNPQDSMATTDVEKSGSPFTSSMAFHSISPTSTLYTFPSSTSITDGNISMVTTSDDTNTGTESTDDPNNKILLFIIIAIIPTLLLLILIAIFLFRRVKERESEPFYKIQVEYTDDNKQRRPRCANSRLDLTIKGMHIDLEFPSPSEKRKSARLSAPPNLSDAQMRELQKLSLECKENLEWINEVLERELDTPVFGGSSSSENDDSMDASCTNQRYSVYSACSEKEKENYEVSEKIIVRDSPKHKKYNEDETEGKSYLQNDADDNNDSETSKDDSDELKIQLDQRTSPKALPKPQKPEIPPKPKIMLTATDGIGTLVNPLTSTILIECSACEDESKGKNKFDPVLSKKNTPKERTLLKKPPVPEKIGTSSRKPEKTLRKPELGLTGKNEAKKESPCLCNRLSTSKPPIPKKPEGLVINRFERKASDGTSGRVSTTLYRSGMKLNVCCAPRKACQAV